MNEVFDRLIIRVLFTIFICLSLFIYKYAHFVLFPRVKSQVSGKFYPSQNKVDTLHFLGRIFGLALIFTTLEFNEYTGLAISSFHFFVWSTLGIILYLSSLWIINSIIFYNFEYKDEVLKKENFTYGIISVTISICTALIIKTLLEESERSLVILSILWLFALVGFGFLTRIYRFISNYHFNSLMIQRDISLAYSYSGFLAGITVIFTSAFGHEHNDIVQYILQVSLKVLLAFILLPIFKMGLNNIFKIQYESDNTRDSRSGSALYEGISFFIAALLASLITSQLNFGTIYPFF